jgi:predicted alpha-1,2-mannosidase
VDGTVNLLNTKIAMRLSDEERIKPQDYRRRLDQVPWKCLFSLLAILPACHEASHQDDSGVSPSDTPSNTDTINFADTIKFTDAAVKADGGSADGQKLDVSADGATQDTAPQPPDSAPLGGPIVQSDNLTIHVNPWMGTTSDGQSFPGAARPFGMIQWSLDNAWKESNQYDYPHSNFAGFSFTHYTGYGPRVGVLLPVAGVVTSSPASVRTIPNTATVSPYESVFNHKDESARPGYYKVRSSSGIVVELSVSDRAGVARMVWPSSAVASLVMDLGNSPTSDDRPIYNQVVVDQANRRLQGFVGKQDYRLYFVIEVDQDFSSVATFNGGTLQAGQSTSAIGTDVGAVVTFPAGATANLRTGLSYVSTQKAQQNLDSEIPKGTTLEQVSAQASARWNDVLSRVQVKDTVATEDEAQKFYTHLYELTLQPNVVSDVDGEYWGADNQSHKLASGHAEYSAISTWDQGRGMWPLLAWLFPSLMSDVAQSYLNVAAQRNDQTPAGFIFPYLASGSARGFGVDAPEFALPAQVYAFGAHGFDTALAIKQLMLVSNSTTVRGGNQTDYLAGHSAPEAHLDFSTTDFAVRQLAQAIGDTSTTATLAGRAGKWHDTFDDTAVDNGSTGYQWFKDSGGNFQAFQTSADGTGSSTANRFTESCSAEMSYGVPQDFGGLITAMGGASTVLKRLDFFFSTFVNIGGNFSDATTQASCRYFTPSNETDLLAPWLANWAGGASHTQSVVHRILSGSYHNTPSGLPGNNDWGALSAWYVAAALGVYPIIPGVGGFTVNTPSFEQVTITFENKHQLLIQTTPSPWGSPYIAGLSINGTAWDSTWIPLGSTNNDSTTNTLGFSLAAQATSWGNTPSGDHAPPSFGNQ